MGLQRSAQIVQMNASVSEILNMAALAALDAIEERNSKVSNLPKNSSKKAKA